MAMTTLSSKMPAEVVRLQFDMSALTSTPTSPVVTVTQMSGPTDPSPQSMKSGLPSVSGAVVTQLIQGGLAGSTYKIDVRFNAGSEVFIESALLPVVN